MQENKTGSQQSKGEISLASSSSTSRALQVKDWKKEDVAQWIKSKFPDHSELEKIFFENEIDAESLLGLTNEKLRDDLVVKQLKVRERILGEISLLKEKSGMSLLQLVVLRFLCILLFL